MRGDTGKQGAARHINEVTYLTDYAVLQQVSELMVSRRPPPRMIYRQSDAVFRADVNHFARRR